MTAIINTEVYISKIYIAKLNNRMETERFLMNNGGKLITVVHVTVLKDGAASITL
jgi:hypothetical protein